jgi:uncharacterized protein (DUF1778 family)
LFFFHLRFINPYGGMHGRQIFDPALRNLLESYEFLSEADPTVMCLEKYDCTRITGAGPVTMAIRPGNNALRSCLDIVGRDSYPLFEKDEPMPARTTRSEKLDLRLTRDAKRALQAAAAVAHRSVSEFVLESALARADEALADRRTFGLNATQWKAFMAALDAPPRPLPRLERLLKEPGFFDAGPNQ